MGGSKKQTVGYWYKWLLHFGWCRGPVDAVLELRGGGATMWSGRITESGRIHIDKPELWGGEDSQGGVQGDWDIMFGEPTQQPNDYLTATLGGTPSETPGGTLSFKDVIELLFARFGPPDESTTPADTLRGQSAHRGKLTTVARGGRFGANIPNPKPVSAKVERILADWQDDQVWYPEKAALQMSPEAQALDISWQLRGSSPDPVDLDASSPQVTSRIYKSRDGGTHAVVVHYSGEVEGRAYPGSVAIPGTADVVSGGTLPDKNTNIYSLEISSPPQTYYLNAGVPEYEIAAIEGSFTVQLDDGAQVTLSWSTGSDVYAVAGPDQHLAIRAEGQDACLAMNPAHILYDSIVHNELQGEPASLINDASFRAAADRFYAEGLGLCAVYDSSKETPEQFQQRICNLVACNLNQSRVDGLYYLDLIRAADDLDSLPAITEDDVVAFKQTPSVLAEAPNLMRVEWFDPVTKEARTTAPIYAAGAIQASGAVIAGSRKYHEVPVESLALRLGKRDLDAGAMPRSTFDLSMLPRFRGLRPGMNARLQLPSEGIADLVVTVGKVDQGTVRDSKMQVALVQNVFALPDAVYIQPDRPVWSAPSTTPKPSPCQIAIEAPYVELVASLSVADLQAMAGDVGYLVAAAVRPVSGMSYELATAVGADAYETAGSGDWCGTLLVTGPAASGDTSFTFTAGQDLERVQIGSWASWEGEIVRVDALDEAAGTLQLARGCADTVPVAHAAGTRIYFCGDWLAGDPREYVGGETVHAKLLTRTTAGKLGLAEATALDLLMDDRANRPYPPGALKINALVYPLQLAGALTATWAHRDRLQQADQLVDTTQPDVGPEAGVTYTVRYYQPPGSLVATEGGLAGTTASPYTFPADGSAVVAVSAIRDGLESWQALAATFDYSVETAAYRVTQAGDRRVTEAGDPRILETP